MQPEPITVPAGTFDSCGVYFEDFDVETVIAPGVGVIRETIIYPGVRWIHTLVDYELVLD